ncbi:dynamin family protein [Streptomyces sp. NPDC090085]|uniref:dynamin family protein n=1 Tax=Streptomyces sp. NPDC090085 TaxID=3365943 RepID=UPI0038097EDB
MSDSDPFRTAAAAAADDRAEDAVLRLLALAEEEEALAAAGKPLGRLAGRWRNPVAQVTVVGEVSVGKSTLINALVETPVLPVAAEALSSIPVELIHGDVLLATVYIRQGAEVVVREVAGEEIEEYLTTRGTEKVAQRHGEDAEVLGAVIAVPSPLLAQGLRLTDTPGVGGLNPAHRRATVAALADTDAVMFAIRPDRPISESELRFLAESVEHVAHYLIVQTHAGQFTDAEDRLRENLAVLRSPQTWTRLFNDETRGRQLAERFRNEVTGVTVSAKNALTAYARRSTPGWERKLELSGISKPADWLRTEVAEQVGLIHRRTLLRLADSTAAAIAERLAGRRSLLAEGEEGERAIQERQKRVYAWIAKHGEVWKPDLDQAAEQAQAEVRKTGAEEVESLRSYYREQFKGKSPKALQGICEELVKEPTSASIRMRGLVKVRLDAAVEKITQGDPEGPVGAGLGRMKASKEMAVRVHTPLTAADFALDDSQVSAAAVAGAGVLSRSLPTNPHQPPAQTRTGPQTIPLLPDGFPFRSPTTVNVPRSGTQSSDWLGGRPRPGTGQQSGGTAALAATALAALPAVAVAAMVTLAVFGGVAVWRKRRAHSREAAEEVLADVLKAIGNDAVEDACVYAVEERDSIRQTIEGRLEEQQAQIERDKADLERHTGLTVDERVGMLNAIDLAERELDAVRTELEEVRVVWNP